MRQAFSSYSGKRVLVTGDTGFKGSWLCLWLRELGAEVVGYALPPESRYGSFCLIGLEREIRHLDGDVRDLETLLEVADRFKPEIVFHLAAQALVRESHLEPKRTFDTNVGGSVNVLEAVRRVPSVRALIYVTSDKCYHNSGWVWGYRENDALGGDDPYSASKAAAEMVFNSYIASYFRHDRRVGAASVRAGNVIGGGDWAKDRIVPDCIRSLRDNQPIQLRNPTSIRPWQHVLEPLSGYLTVGERLLTEPGRFTGAWNFGPQNRSARTVEDLANAVVHHWAGGEVRVQREDSAPPEAEVLTLNCDKANRLLNWAPQWDFETAVEKTVAWYRQIAGDISLLDVSRQQIHDYMEAL
jgi:CDP-glucose 4,6-dehydratase